MPYITLNPDNATVIPPPEPDPSEPLVSGGMTLFQAREELRSMLVGRLDIEDPRLDFWLNRAYVDLATSMHKQDELKASLDFETLENQAMYLLPELVTTTLNVARLDDDNPYGGVPLEKTDLVWYRRQKDFRDLQERKPTHYFRMNRLLVVWPTPDDTYTITLDYRFEPKELLDDNEVPILRREWHEAWLTLARKKLLSAVNEFEAALAVGQEFTGHMRTRLDREGGEEENKIVSSSAPRSPREFRRRSRSDSDYFGRG
jgi:hypothetical protein